VINHYAISQALGNLGFLQIGVCIVINLQNIIDIQKNVYNFANVKYLKNTTP
jgi:hypothetical protein